MAIKWAIRDHAENYYIEGSAGMCREEISVPDATLERWYRTFEEFYKTQEEIESAIDKADKDRGTPWAIRSTTEIWTDLTGGGFMWWSNADGWVLFSQATQFTEKEMERVHLPNGGVWEMHEEYDPSDHVSHEG